jgi:hypothetical protein
MLIAGMTTSASVIRISSHLLPPLDGSERGKFDKS